MRIHKLSDLGREKYKSWLDERGLGEMPPAEFLDGSFVTKVAIDIELDLKKVFRTRFEFGRYIADLLVHREAKEMLSQENDGMWDWLTIAYFSQFGKKVSKPPHYTVTRHGRVRSLAYRHLARTAFEMYWRHGEAARVMLSVDMSTLGDLCEQLTSRQDIAYHRGIIQTANAMYLTAEGNLRRGAANRVKPLNKRKPGDTSGRGGARRLALAVQRLCRTYDTHILDSEKMIHLLPKEFMNFVTKREVAPVF